HALRGQGWPLPPAPVHDGDPPAAWGPDAEAGLPAQNCQWRTAPASVWSDRTGSRHGYHEYYNDGGTSGQSLHCQRPEDLHLACTALRLDDFACPDHSARSRQEEV